MGFVVTLLKVGIWLVASFLLYTSCSIGMDQLITGGMANVGEKAIGVPMSHDVGGGQLVIGGLVFAVAVFAHLVLSGLARFAGVR